MPQAKEEKKTKCEMIKDEIVKEIISFGDDRPNLAILAFAELKPDYLVDLEKEAKRVGVDTHLYQCPIGVDDEEVEAMIMCLNDDEMIDAILIEEPLPREMDMEELVSQIKADKDINYDLGAPDEDMRQALIFQNTLDRFKERRG
jgi:methylenetetrahydrofolate dehydrogenase (NADP+)/methenyltetrahydrofolate cyclohydrolase